MVGRHNRQQLRSMVGMYKRVINIEIMVEIMNVDGIFSTCNHISNCFIAFLLLIRRLFLVLPR